MINIKKQKKIQNNVPVFKIEPEQQQQEQQQEQQTRRRCPAPGQSRTQGLPYVVRATPSL